MPSQAPLTEDSIPHAALRHRVDVVCPDQCEEVYLNRSRIALCRGSPNYETRRSVNRHPRFHWHQRSYKVFQRLTTKVSSRQPLHVCQRLPPAVGLNLCPKGQIRFCFFRANLQRSGSFEKIVTVMCSSRTSAACRLAGPCPRRVCSIRKSRRACRRLLSFHARPLVKDYLPCFAIISPYRTSKGKRRWPSVHTKYAIRDQTDRRT